MKKISRDRYVFRIFTLLFFLVLFICNCHDKKDSPATNPIKFNGFTMGTTYTVKIVRLYKSTPPQREQAVKRVKSDIEATLETINRQMSVFREDSEISAFNRHQGMDWFGLSPDTALVLDAAFKISSTSSGAFDVTIGPLIDLWGFGSKLKKRQLPEKHLIEAVKEQIGFEKMEARLQPPAVRKKNPQLKCNLSAIAKGFGVDKVAEVLDKGGFPNYLVEIGGEVKGKGVNHNNVRWRIGVATPGEGMDIQNVVQLNDDAMATSGDYRNYFEEGGVRYSHTIDPASGYPITHKLASVTVIHKSCMMADGWATALNVLGPERGYQLALKENLAVYMIVRSGKSFITKQTPQFTQYLKSSQQ